MKAMFYFISAALLLTAVFSPALTQDSLNIRLVGATANLNQGNGYVTVLQDQYAFVQGTGSVSSIDVSDPENPMRLGRWDFGGSDQYSLGLKVRGDYAYVAHRGMNFNIGDFSDIRNPEGVFQYGYVQMGNARARDIQLDGDYAFVLSAGGTFHVFDVNDPPRTQEVGQRLNLNGNYLGMSLALAGDYALATSGNLFVISLEDPLRPAVESEFDLEPYVGNKVVVDGNYAYVGAARDNGAGGSVLFFLDISDVENPREIARLEDLPTSGYSNPMDIAISGDNLFVTANFALSIIDISEPADPRPSAWYTPEDGACSVVVRDNLAYVGGRNRLSVFDCSDALGFPSIEVPEGDQAHDYGNVAVGRAVEWPLTISNAGQWPLHIEGLAVDDAEAFSLTEASCRWRLDGWFNVGEALQDQCINGVEYVEGSFYVTGGANREAENWIYVLDDQGREQRRFAQFAESPWGMRDLTWDGELLWGADRRRIYGFTTEGELVHQFEGPLDVTRSLAWDPERQLLWVSDIASALYTMTAEGEVLQARPLPQTVRIYGLAWDAQAEGGFNLLIFGSDEENPLALFGYNPETGEMREVNPALRSELEDGRAGGGLGVTSDWDPPLRHIYGTIDGAGDAVGLWQITDYYREEQYTIAAGSSLDVGVVFHPAQRGETVGELTIFSDDGDDPELLISLVGVGSENLAPEWDNPPERIEILAGNRIEVGLTARDAEGDALALSMIYNDLPRSARLIDAGDGRGLFVWETAAKDTGNYTPSLVISDGLAETTLEMPVVVLTPNGAGAAGEEAPSTFAISSIYPNPFNSTTAITIQLPEKGLAQVRIVDLNGRLIQSLLDRELTAGSHSLVWNAEGLPSGRYFIKAQAGQLNAVKAISLTK